MINITDSDIIDIDIGNIPIEKAFLGNQLVWEKNAGIIEDVDGVKYRIKNYIACTGTVQKYITLRTFTSTNSIEFQVYKAQNTAAWVGTRTGTAAKNYFAIAGYGGGINLNFGVSSPVRIINGVSNNAVHTIKYSNKQIFLDGTKVYDCPNTTVTTTTAITLGKVNGRSEVCKDRFHYFKWWDANDELVYDLIPVQRISDSVWGFFDKVSMTFKPSNGTEQFTGG